MKKKYSEFTQEQKDRYMQSCYKRRVERKKTLVDLKGGKCQQCGYNKCLRSLSFHHRDPSTKSFALDARLIAAKPMELLIKEIDKCDLLCLNCHMELEDKLGTEGIEPSPGKL